MIVKKPFKVLMTVATALILAGAIMAFVVNTIHFFPYKGDRRELPTIGG